MSAQTCYTCDHSREETQTTVRRLHLVKGYRFGRGDERKGLSIVCHTGKLINSEPCKQWLRAAGADDDEA